jgi:hypothetical protein
MAAEDMAPKRRSSAQAMPAVTVDKSGTEDK